MNSQKVLTQRLQQCITQRQQLPNAVAVDFTAQGDLYKTVNQFNGWVRSGVAQDPEFGRALAKVRPIEKPPYFALTGA